MSLESMKSSTFSVEQQAVLRKERALNDAKLIKEGAEYGIGENGDLRFEVTADQIEDARKEMDLDLEIKNFSEDERKYYEGYSKIFSMGKEVCYMRNSGKIDDNAYGVFMQKIGELGKDGRMKLKELGDEGFRKVEKVIREESRQKTEKMFAEAEDFSQLVDAINWSGGIRGSEQFFSAGTLKDVIEKVRDGKSDISNISRANGLRKAVVRIMEKDREGSEKNNEKRLVELREKLNIGHDQDEQDRTVERLVDGKELEKIFMELNRGRGGAMETYKAVINAQGSPVSRPDMFAEYGGYHPSLLRNFIRKYPTRADFEEFSIKYFPNASMKEPGRIGSENLSDLADILYKEKIPKSIEPSEPDIPISDNPLLENPTNVSDVLPGTEIVSDQELASKGIDPKLTGNLYPYSSDVENYMKERFNGYPKIGAYGLNTSSGKVNGRLIWSDGRVAVFETPQGKLKLPFEEIISPNGETYGEMERSRKDEEERRRMFILGQSQGPRRM